MTHDHIHDSTAANVLSWSSQGAHMQHSPDEEAAAEVDEPPDDISFSKQAKNEFKRNAVQKQKEKSESLLTKALNHIEEETTPDFRFSSAFSRRRSMNSTISLASTVDLTPDTGLTSPARTSTPSPPPPMFALPRLATAAGAKSDFRLRSGDHGNVGEVREAAGALSAENLTKVPAAEGVAKKRCISFACGPKPEAKKTTVQYKSPESKPLPKPVEEPKPERRTCIKFACPSKPSTPAPTTESKETTSAAQPPVAVTKDTNRVSIPRTCRSPSISRNRSRRSSTPRPLPQVPENKKYLTVNHGDMNSESARFHEFASDEPQEEDWIRLNSTGPGKRLTINDTLRKENEIRRLGKEAEDEALDELEEEEQGDLDDDGDDDEDEDEDEEDDGNSPDIEDDVEDEDEEDEDVDDEDDDDDGTKIGDQSVYDSADEGSGVEGSDGYNTDNEVGFADSDDDDNDGGDLELWTLSQGRLSDGTPIYRRPSLASNNSDSSTSSEMARTTPRRTRGRTQRIKIRPGTPELPDSTDFVCGTLDEDRVLEDAYISCVAARRREKLHIIPQDIDPSFPTSEPEDEDGDGEPRKAIANSDDHVWIHGELEDLHHDKTRGTERHRKKPEHVSPKRYRSPPPKRHSPPPKRHHSPAPKGRGRSPRQNGALSPRRLASPPPRRLIKSPTAPLDRTMYRGRQVLGPFPVGPQAKSLPRAPAIFPQHLKGPRRTKHLGLHGGHVRGAIDIVKGLEQKRQRRKEKFKEKYFYKHCNRARKGQTHDKKPQPGQGAERMREIGLFMAGKRVQGQFVLSI